MKRIKIIGVILLALSLLTVLCSCKNSPGTVNGSGGITNPHETDETFTAVILQSDNGKDSTEIRQGFIARMRTLGYDESKMKFDIKNAAGKSDTLRSLAVEIGNKKYDLAVAVGEAAAVALKTAGVKTPCVFINVDDPVKSGLVTSLTEPDGNMTGVTSKTSFEALIPVMQISTPNVLSIGIIYTSTDEAATKAAQYAQKMFSDSAFSVVMLGVDSSKQLIDGAGGLIEQVDSLYLIGNDEITERNLEYILDAADSASKLVFSANQAYVQHGALMSVCAGNEDMARAGALLADKIMQGEKISNIPVTTDVDLSIYFNREMADRYDIEPPINIQKLFYL